MTSVKWHSAEWLLGETRRITECSGGESTELFCVLPQHLVIRPVTNAEEL